MIRVVCYITKQAVGARVGAFEGATDGFIVDGVCEGPVGDSDGATGCELAVGQTVVLLDGTAVGRHRLKV